MTRDSFAAGSNNGDVKLFQHGSGGNLEEKMSWDKLHTFIKGEFQLLCICFFVFLIYIGDLWHRLICS